VSVGNMLSDRDHLEAFLAAIDGPPAARVIAAAIGVALDAAAEAKQKQAAPASQPKRGDGFAALKAAAARRRETRGSSSA
jgi:hypothetical protein